MTVVINGLDPEKLMKVVETVKENWEMGRTVWKASTTWEGGFTGRDVIEGVHSHRR